MRGRLRAIPHGTDSTGPAVAPITVDPLRASESDR